MKIYHEKGAVSSQRFVLEHPPNRVHSRASRYLPVEHRQAQDGVELEETSTMRPIVVPDTTTTTPPESLVQVQRPSRSLYQPQYYVVPAFSYQDSPFMYTFVKTGGEANVNWRLHHK